MDALNWLSVQEATSGISFLWSTQWKLIVKDRKGKTSPIRGYRIQTTGPTRLGYETLFRWEIVYLPPAIKVRIFSNWGLLSVSYLSFKGCRVDLFEKKGSINLSNCPLELSSNFHETSPLPKHHVEVEKKSLKRLHVLNHMFIFNLKPPGHGPTLWRFVVYNKTTEYGPHEGRLSPLFPEGSE